VIQKTGRVVLLNGPPSCGKTTLARELQLVLDAPTFHRSLDDFRAGYRDADWRADDGTLFERVMLGYLGALRAMALAGNDLIAEAVVTPARLDVYLESFDGLAVVFVAVRCPVEVARAREARRTDRLGGPIELPADMYDAVYAHGAFDVEVDTSIGTPTAIARQLAELLAATTPTAFDRLRSR
jgi:chloramphenicol 3-O phosphotransferase